MEGDEAYEGGREPRAGSVPIRTRGLAVTALLASAVALVALPLLLARNVGWAAGALAGIALAGAGGWWMITERVPRRLIGAAGFAVGLLIAVGSVVAAAADERFPLLRVALLLAAAAVAVITARMALRGELEAIETHRARRVTPPRHPVLICNPKSGDGKVARFELDRLAREMGVETVMLEPGSDLAQLARDAVARGADCLGMAGGDGSQALVASIAIEHGIPFVCVSAGTRNHFALDLGIDREDPRGSLRAFRDAVERRVDYATVNGRLFVNNASLGVYAAVVQEEGYRGAKRQTAAAMLPELLGRTEEPFDLRFTTPDGRTVDGAFMVLVSNNPYVMGLSPDTAQRRQLDTGRLGVIALTGTSGANAARLVTLAAVGRPATSPDWVEFTTDRLTIDARSGEAALGVDGESLRIATPLEFRIHPGGLRMLVTEDNPAAAARRRARGVDVRDLLSLARGRRPARLDAGG